MISDENKNMLTWFNLEPVKFLPKEIQGDEITLENLLDELHWNLDEFIDWLVYQSPQEFHLA
jgi:hypothetical protein